MTQHISTNPENQVSRRAEIARQLQEAVREADAYNGPDPVDYFRAHGDWDREDAQGHLWHDKDGVTPMPDGSFMPCPYCRVRELQRLQRRLWFASKRMSSHEYQ